MDNLSIYNKVRAVPKEALKTIEAGRLRGKSDINPMWRLKELTEQFGICGIGWKYVIAKQWLEDGANGEISAFVNIELYIKVDGTWSEAIPGTGGSAFVAKEKAGLYTSDECFKMALTDAISVACKALGFAADVYWATDNTKYNRQQPSGSEQGQGNQPNGAPQLQPNLIKKLHVQRQKLGVDEDAFKAGLTKMVGFEVKSLHDLAKLSRQKLNDLMDAMDKRIVQKSIATTAESEG